MMTDPYIGKMLDNRYEILERIGTGGMAVVYKAKCHRLNRLVAIKILKDDLAQDEDFRRRFNAESQAVAQLSHPNIVSVYDVSRGGDTEYNVMELIDGITLKQYMEKRGQLNWRESLHFITQIMRGLSHAHSRGIVHRDIKPQNVMVLRDGSVKVADFGIACLENSAQTLTQEALGSVHYISPEQARGDRTDARSDIYSAGVVLYEMLTGRLPFEGDSAVSVAIQHLSSIPLAPREIRPDIPEQLELICMKAMAPELDKRYPSADAMIADLESFRKNPDVALDIDLIDLRPEETDEPTRLIRVPAGGTASRPVREREPVRERRRDYDDYEPPRKEGKGRTVLIAAVAVVAVVAAVFLFKSIFSSFDKPAETYAVPSVLGLTVEQAKELETVKDIFTIVVDGSDFSDNYGKDEIMEQSPKEGELRKGESLEIHVTVSLGEDTGVMPDITGTYTVASARTEMKALIEWYSLTLEAPEESRQFSDEVAADYIISTDPKAGEALKKGDTIRIVVSKGPQTVTVPPFTNIHIDQVTSQLDAMMGLQIGDVTEVDSDKPKGYVVDQDPAPQSEVPEGTKVNLTISNGSQSGEGSTGTGKGEEVVMIPLPTDRETVHLQLFQDGSMIFDDVLPCSMGNYPVTLTGIGTSILDIYLDGEHTTREVTFDSYE